MDLKTLRITIWNFCYKMVDVTSENFDVVLPQILKDIKEAAFIAVDTEFTGLLADDDFKNNFFDDGARRYQKLCQNIDKFSVCQLGLAVFKGVLHKNAYTATCYNFYLRPHSCVSFDPTFMCQSSSVEFLQRYGFDFNKWMYSGIKFLNTDEAEQLHAELIAILEGDRLFDLPFEVKDQLSDVGEWAASAIEGDTTTPKNMNSITSQVLFITSIHHRFPELSVEEENGKIVVQKLGGDTNADAQATTKMREIISRYVNKMLGFTIVFRYMTELQKPLVLHNCLLDILLIYKQFHKNLPQSYVNFKSEVHRIFPLIYDTKFLAAEIRHEIRTKDEKASTVLNKTGLGDLASSLQKDLPVLHRPTLVHEPPSSKYSTSDPMLHEAGYDAYLTGLCFLNMAHLYAMITMTSKLQHRPMSPREHVYALKNFANRINMQRARIRYMELSGSDPRHIRPSWLIVERRQNCRNFSPSMVSTALSQYGQLDVIPHKKNSVLVATGNWQSASRIVKELGEGGPFTASKYSRLRHSPLVRTLAWSGVIASTGLSAWIIYNTIKKTSNSS